MKPITYFSLISKETNSEVYTSPNYVLDNWETTDYYRVFDRFKFYFDRVNSGIKQQLESPRTPEEQKKNLKYLSPDNYLVAYMSLHNDGGYHRRTFWTNELSNYSEFKKYN